jgi:hypothetical protein
LAVLAVDLWLARRWLNERPLPAWSGWRRGGRVAGDARSTAFARLPPRTSSLGLLVWHEWRQSRATIAAIWATILAFLAFVFLARGMVWGPLYERLVHEILELLTDGILPLVAAVSGACVFLGDQRRCRFRFFAEHGISPRRVWLSRQLVWLTTPCIWAFLVTAAVLAVHAWGWPATEYRGMRGENLDLLRSLGLALSLYCVAQAAPLFVRSVAIGFFGSLLGCLGFGIWVGMMSSCRVPIWFSIAPIPLCLLLATWLRAPDWIVEQATWRSRLRAAMSIGGPLAAVGIAVICYRVFEVPQVKLSFDPAAYRRPPSAAAVRTSELYCEAYTLMAPVPQVESVDAWVAETANDEQRQARRRIADEIPQRREQAVARILQASQRGECWFPPRWDSSRAWQTATTSSQLGGNMSFSLSQLRMAGEEADQLAWHVLETARPLEETGMLDEAQELYGAAMRCAHQLQRQTDLAYQDAGDRIEAETCARLARWAARPGQTAERLRSVRQRLQREFFTDLPQRRGVLIGAYLEARDGFGLDSMAADAPRLSEVVWHRRARWIIPWEYVRLGRLLDLYVETGLTRLQAVETSLVQYGSAGEVARQACPESLATLLDTTPLAQPRLSGSLLEAHRRDRRPVWDALLAQAVRHRVLQLQLALLAWRLKHGELPESLEQLIGSEIDQLPVNSFSGSVFLYRPRGVETPLVAAATTSLSTRPSPEKATRIEPHTPILWCNGPYLRARMPARSTDAIEPSERVYQPWDSPPGPSRQPQNEAETWGLGWAFPIPVPAVPDSTPKTPDAALNE